VSRLWMLLCSFQQRTVASSFLGPNVLLSRLKSTQTLSAMSTRNLPGPRKAWQPQRHLWDNILKNVGSSTHQKPMGLHGKQQGHSPPPPPWNTFSLCFLSYKTRGKIIVSYILIFMFLCCRREDKRFWSES
jgi:hypothetical protein